MIAKELTERQIKVLRFIERTVAVSGYPPTIREIGNEFGIKSTNGVNDHLRALMRKGYLAKEPGKSRTLTLLQPKVKRVRRAKPQGAIPILGKVDDAAANADMFAVFNAQEQMITVYKKETDTAPTVLSSFRVSL
jgi:repressor LexA